MNSLASFDGEMGAMYDKAFRKLGRSGKILIDSFFKILDKSIGITAVKREVTELLQRAFLSTEWSKEIITSVLVIVILRAPVMIAPIITMGWIRLADLPPCMTTMSFKHTCPAANKPVLQLMGPSQFFDVELMNRFIRNHPKMINKLKADDIPDEARPFILETMGLHMVTHLWAPGVDIIRKETVPLESVNIFFRAALRYVHPTAIVAYLATIDIGNTHYRFYTEEMLALMAEPLCKFFITFHDKPKAMQALQRVHWVKSSPAIIVELLSMFLQRNPFWTYEIQRRACNLIEALNFTSLDLAVTVDTNRVIPACVRIFASRIPVEMIRRTSLFAHDEEILGLLLRKGYTDSLHSSMLQHIDIGFLMSVLPDFIRNIEGAWGTMMYWVDHIFSDNHVAEGFRIRKMLFAFLVNPATINRLFVHNNGNYYLHLSDREFMVARNVGTSTERTCRALDIPVQIHPMDLICGYNHDTYDFPALVIDNLRDFMHTEECYYPLLFHFYTVPPPGRRALGARIMNTTVILAELFTKHAGLGITVKPVFGLENVEIRHFVNGYIEPLKLLFLSDDIPVNWEAVNQLIVDYFGFSLFTLINWQDFRAARGNPDVVWPAFMMQPAFQALLPTFYDLHGSDLYRDRREIFQIDCFISDPTSAGMTTTYSPWLKYNINEPVRAPVRSRLMHVVPDHPQLQGDEDHYPINVFSPLCVESGIQMMVALQLWGNSQTLLNEVLVDALLLEITQVELLTKIRYYSTKRAFYGDGNSKDSKQIVWSRFALWPSEKPKPPTEQPMKVQGLPIMFRDDTLPKKKKPVVFAKKWNDDVVVKRLSEMPNEVLSIIYKHLVRESLQENRIPVLRELIPDYWWNTPKQTLFYFSDYEDPPYDLSFYVRTPVEGLTDANGVLYGRFQAALVAFFGDMWRRAMKCVGYEVEPKVLWRCEFIAWPRMFSEVFTKSETLVLPGGLFEVKFNLVLPEYRLASQGFYLTIGPHRSVHRIHDCYRRLPGDYSMVVKDDRKAASAAFVA